MSFDEKKNTLSQLNAQSRSSLVKKGISHATRERHEFQGAASSSRYVSPNQSRRAPSRAQSRGVNQVSTNNLSRLLSGRPSRVGSPSRSFVSGAEPSSEYQPPVLVKRAYTQNRPNFISSPAYGNGRRSQNSLDDSSGLKQHTFYPSQLHQIIPEQLNEETYRNGVQMNTANFRREDGSPSLRAPVT